MSTGRGVFSAENKAGGRFNLRDWFVTGGGVVLSCRNTTMSLRSRVSRQARRTYPREEFVKIEHGRTSNEGYANRFGGIQASHEHHTPASIGVGVVVRH